MKFQKNWAIEDKFVQNMKIIKKKEQMKVRINNEPKRKISRQRKQLQKC